MYFSDAYLNSPRQPIYINSGTIVVWIINQHSRLRSTAMMFFCLPKTHGGSPARRLFYRWPGGWVGLKPRDMARWIEGNFEIMNMYLLHPPEHFLLQNGESMVSIYIYIKWTWGIRKPVSYFKLIEVRLFVSRDLVWQGGPQGFIPFLSSWHLWCVC